MAQSTIEQRRAAFDRTNPDLSPGASRTPFPIVPSDAVPLPALVKGIYVGTGGDVTLRGVGSDAQDVTYKNLPDASYLQVAALYVRATGTTATNLVGEA